MSHPIHLERPTRRGGTKRVSVGVPREEARIQKWLTKGLMRQPLQPGYSRIVCSELNVSSGIADVVSATTNGTAHPASWLPRRALKLVNLTTAKLLTQLKCRRYRPIAALAMAAGVSLRTAAQHLRLLEQLSLVKLRNESAMLLTPARSGFRHIDAFEVKVSDWRHGLYQATHYRSFANCVAVALPDKKAKMVAVNKKPFQTFGVGLVGVTPNSSLHWYIKPKRRPAASASKELFSLIQILRTSQAKALRTP
jgi:hypothetical protein